MKTLTFPRIRRDNWIDNNPSEKKKNIIDGVTATVGVVLLVAIGYNLVKDTIELVWRN